MRLKTGLLLILLSSVSAPALAAPEPTRAEPWEWVKALPIPAPDPARSAAPIQSLLLAAQTRYGDEADEHYVEYALRIQDPQGLAAGAVAIPWHPDLSDLVIHKVHIVRDGKAVDVLGAGQEFMVLRRENNLERAMLDGILTAVLQPEGLAVGDTVNVAFTIRRTADRNGFRSENMQLLAPGMAIERLYLREVWPTERELRWRASERMPKPKVEKTKLGSELILDAADAVAPDAPADAPPRFRIPPSLEVSEYQSWNEISSIAAPLYASASELRPDSPLRAEIEKIAASTADPGKRAMAALRLVQDKIRYVALAMGDGGVVPASADQTWSRKYGDCKGKTVTLLALLKGLGIEAEPMLVSSAFGDSLSERLPMARIFDHVLVRARIGSKDYYLDGTRIGDRMLEELASSPYGSGLPLRVAGASLEKLPLLPPALPLTDVKLTYDASNGFFSSIPVSGEILFRGDMAVFVRAALAEMGIEEFRKKARELAPDIPEGQDIRIDVRDEEALGSIAITFKGTQQMDWAGGPRGKALRFQFDSETIRWEPEFKREEGPFKQTPYLLAFPAYIASTETVILPRSGTGFTLDGKNLDRTVAGTHITRSLSLENGRAIARSTFRRLQSELSAAEAAASADILRQINAETASVRAPADYQLSEADKAAMRAREPETATAFVDRGYALMQEGKNKSALEAFDRAIALAPEWGIAHSNRAIALLHRDMEDEAEKSLARAAALDDKDFVLHQGYGLLHARRGESEKAVEAFTTSLSLDPGNVFNLHHRASAYEQLGKLEEALADVEKVIVLEPKETGALWRSARLNAALGRTEAALAAAAKAVALKPDDVFLTGYRGELLARFGRREEAQRAFDAAIRLADEQIATSTGGAMHLVLQKISLLSLKEDHKAAIGLATSHLKKQPDSIQYLTARCLAHAFAATELEAGLKDCNLALKLEPENAPATDARAFINLRMGKWDEAIRNYGDMLRYLPNTPRAHYGRGIAKLRKGDKAGGEADLAAAKRYSFDTYAEFESVGIRP